MTNTNYKSACYLTSIIQHVLINVMTSISGDIMGDIIGDINDIRN